MSSFFPKVKEHRLVVTWHMRSTAEPTFHVGLLLEKNSGATDDAIKFHITNSVDDYGGHLWRYESYAVTPSQSRHLVARIVVAKLPSSLSLTQWKIRIDALLGNSLNLTGGGYNCRSWAFAALRKLLQEGGEDFSSIPRLLPVGTGQLEYEMVKTAVQGRHNLLTVSLQNCIIPDPLILDIRGVVDSPKRAT